MWAAYAIPLASLPPKYPVPFASCNNIHDPNTTNAGNLINKKTIKTVILLVGKSNKYPPITPDIAPEAPRLGIK